MKNPKSKVQSPKLKWLMMFLMPLGCLIGCMPSQPPAPPAAAPTAEVKRWPPPRNPADFDIRVVPVPPIPAPQKNLAAKGFTIVITNRTYHAPPVEGTNIYLVWLPDPAAAYYEVLDGTRYGSYDRRTVTLTTNAVIAIATRPAHYFAVQSFNAYGVALNPSPPVGWMPPDRTNLFLRGGSMVIQFAQTNQADRFYVDASNEITGVWMTIYKQSISLSNGVVDVSVAAGSNRALGLFRVGRSLPAR